MSLRSKGLLFRGLWQNFKVLKLEHLLPVNLWRGQSPAYLQECWQLSKSLINLG